MLDQSVKYQFLAGIVASILACCYGISLGWASPTILLLTSDESPLPSGKMTMEEVSWIAGLLPLASLVGSIFYCYIINIFGRKLPLLSMSIPVIASWSLVIFAQNVYYLYIARILQGVVAGGVVFTALLFLIEVSSDRIRGALSSTVLLSTDAGYLIAYILGTFFNFYITPIVMIISTVLFTILFLLFPESPVYLVKQNKISEAEKAICFYQNIRKETKNGESAVQSEIQRLKDVVGGSETKNHNKSSIKWSDFMTRPARKAMLIGIVLSSLNQLSGCFALLNYSAFIFQESGSSLSPNISTIYVGVLLLIGTIVLISLVDVVGRKFLYICSTIGTSFGLITLGAYMMLKSWDYDVKSYNSLPLFSLLFAIFCASPGILSLPISLTGEILPQNIKDFGIAFCNTLLSLLGFLALKFLPLLTDLVGFHGTMFLFGGICLSSTVFIIFYVPETKNKSYGEIMKSLQ